MACESEDSREVLEAFSVGLETCHIEVESTLERLDRVEASEGTSWMGTSEKSGGEKGFELHGDGFWSWCVQKGT